MAEARYDDQLGDCRTKRHLIHDHILTLVEGSDWICSMCDESTQGSDCYCCTESGCKFYLHKTCAELPPHIDLPLFHQHTLYLQKRPATALSHYFCRICYDHCEIFYRCLDCNVGVDVKCALLPQSKVEPFSHAHPLILATRKKRLVNTHACFGCEEATLGPIYSCVHCNFYLHKKCAELPPTITHPSHRKHPLSLFTNIAPPFHKKFCYCRICLYQRKGFVFHCSLCKFDLKIKHIFSSQVETGTHQHPFNRISKPMSFICDACGSDGDCIPYVCTTCNLALHKDCILLPKFIKTSRHIHPLSHSYFLLEPGFERLDCRICHAQVNIEYGNYYCAKCKYISHVHCALNPMFWEREVKEPKHGETSGLFLDDDSATSAEDVTATEIKHFGHQHNLKLEEEMKSDDIYCDGCVRPISSGQPFYLCDQCDFFLHKSCAKLPMRSTYWLFPNTLSLLPYGIFVCWNCNLYSSGFSYYTESFKRSTCLRCFGLSDTVEHQGHQHPLFFDQNFEGNCSACGILYFYGYKCKYCNFGVCSVCIYLPKTTQYKNHINPLVLNYHDSSDDPSQHYCDICEEKRDPWYWFYGCPDCDFTAHVFCTLSKFPYVKRGLKFRHKNHPHRLVTVQKVYYYPLCIECGKPCHDLAVECEASECYYICHWECLQFPPFLPITDGNDS